MKSIIAIALIGTFALTGCPEASKADPNAKSATASSTASGAAKPPTTSTTEAKAKETGEAVKDVAAPKDTAVVAPSPTDSPAPKK